MISNTFIITYYMTIHTFLIYSFLNLNFRLRKNLLVTVMLGFIFDNKNYFAIIQLIINHHL